MWVLTAMLVADVCSAVVCRLGFDFGRRCSRRGVYVQGYGSGACCLLCTGIDSNTVLICLVRRRSSCPCGRLECCVGVYRSTRSHTTIGVEITSLGLAASITINFAWFSSGWGVDAVSRLQFVPQLSVSSFACLSITSRLILTNECVSLPVIL